MTIIPNQIGICVTHRTWFPADGRCPADGCKTTVHLYRRGGGARFP